MVFFQAFPALKKHYSFSIAFPDFQNSVRTLIPVEFQCRLYKWHLNPICSSSNVSTMIVTQPSMHQQYLNLICSTSSHNIMIVAQPHHLHQRQFGLTCYNSSLSITKQLSFTIAYVSSNSPVALLVSPVMIVSHSHL